MVWEFPFIKMKFEMSEIERVGGQDKSWREKGGCFHPEQMGKDKKLKKRKGGRNRGLMCVAAY